MALVASWGALCLHTVPTGTYFPLKGRNFGKTSSSSPAPLVVISYLYFAQALLVVYPLLALVVVSIISAAHLVAHLDNLFVATPNLCRKAKIW